MAKKEAPQEGDVLTDSIEAFKALAFPDQQAYLKQLEAIHQEAVDARVRALREELAALGGMPVATVRKPRVVDGDRVRAAPRAKYRSKSNPELSWSGRGRQASWLVAEMEETGLDKEAFLIHD